MEEGKGKCEHGEFDLKEGCPQCIAKREAGEGQPKTNIVKVRFSTTDESSKGYTYYSEDRLDVGDSVMVPVRGTVTKGTVIAIDVPESEVEAFKDKVKTIPAHSVRPSEDAEVNSPENIQKRIEAVQPKEEAKLSPEVVETILAKRPGSDMEVIGHFGEALRVLEFAKARVIATVEDVKLTNDDLALISKLKKAMETKRKSLLDPLKAQSDAIRETYTFLMAPVLEAGEIYREKMLAYNAEQDRIRKEQEEINRKRQEAAEQEMRLKGELSESVGLVEVMPEASKKVSTELGSSGQRDNWKWQVEDFALLPDEYKVVDGSMLTAVAKKHHDQKQVPGVRFYNKPIITVRTR